MMFFREKMGFIVIREAEIYGYFEATTKPSKIVQNVVLLL